MTLDIAAIKARADKATAGPWAWNSRHGLGAPNRLVMWPSHEYGCDLDIEGEEADLDFIAHARTDIPALIAALEASETARVKAEQERDACGGLAAQAVNDLAMSQNRIAALEAERDAVKEALKPFARWCLFTGDDNDALIECTDDVAVDEFASHTNAPTIGDLRAARRVLEAKP